MNSVTPAIFFGFQLNIQVHDREALPVSNPARAWKSPAAVRTGYPVPCGKLTSPGRPVIATYITSKKLLTSHCPPSPPFTRMCYYNQASNITFGKCGCTRMVPRTDGSGRNAIKWKPGSKCRCNNYLGFWVEGTYTKKGESCDAHRMHLPSRSSNNRAPVTQGGAAVFQARRPDRTGGGGRQTGGKKGGGCVMM